MAGSTLEGRYESRIKEIGACKSKIPEMSARLQKMRCDAKAKPHEIAALERTIKDLASDKTLHEFMLKASPLLRAYNDCLERERSGGRSTSAAVNGRYAGMSRARLLEEYITDVEGVSNTKIENANAVCRCGEVYAIHHSEALYVCKTCGIAETFIDPSNAALNYDDQFTLNVNPSFAYKRLNHFLEWLSQLQGLETTTIPEDVLNSLRMEMKKDRTEIIVQSKIRDALKRLKLQKYYEHVPHICGLLGSPPPVFTRKLQDKLKSMFEEIQIPFKNHCPPARKNFLSYGYVLYKFCQLLEQDHLLDQFPLLKSREKLHAQDMIWKGICADLKWQFLKTV